MAGVSMKDNSPVRQSGSGGAGLGCGIGLVWGENRNGMLLGNPARGRPMLFASDQLTSYPNVSAANASIL
jgi:hypothetical protein